MSQRGISLDGAACRAPFIRLTLQLHIALLLTLCSFFSLTSTAGSAPEATSPTKVVTLRVDGEERKVTTQKDSVRTLLHQEGVTLNKHDRCEPSLTTTLEDGMTVVVYRITCEQTVETVSVPPPTITRYSYRMGKTPVVVQEGKPGVAKRTHVVWKKDGVISEEWTNEPVVVVKPRPKIVVKGNLSSRGVVRKTLTMRSTAYTPYDAGCNGITATGMRAGRGVVAVDPRVIPLGTRLYVDGYGPAVAADTGGAIKGNIIDVCVPTKKEAFQWGRRTVTVMILE